MPAVLWTVLGPVAHVRMAVQGATADQEVGFVAVVLAALAGSAGALGIAWVARRIARRPRVVFLSVALALLLLSLTGPFALAVSPGAAYSLAGLHVAVGLTVLPMLVLRLGSR